MEFNKKKWTKNWYLPDMCKIFTKDPDVLLEFKHFKIFYHCSIWIRSNVEIRSIGSNFVTGMMLLCSSAPQQTFDLRLAWVCCIGENVYCQTDAFNDVHCACTHSLYACKCFINFWIYFNSKKLSSKEKSNFILKISQSK